MKILIKIDQAAFCCVPSLAWAMLLLGMALAQVGFFYLTISGDLFVGKSVSQT